MGIEPPFEHIPFHHDSSVELALGPALCLGADVNHEAPSGPHLAELGWRYPADTSPGLSDQVIGTLCHPTNRPSLYSSVRTGTSWRPSLRSK